MQVSISKASEMAGVTRATFYRHIDKKGISVVKDDEGNPKVDVSELIRVYGHKIKTVSEDTSNNTGVSTSEHTVKQDNNSAVGVNVSAELELLKEKIKHLEENKAVHEKERQREREQFEERVVQLQKTLDKAQENQNKTTALLEHYTQTDNKGGDWKNSIKALEDKIANQEKEAKKKAEAETKEKEDIQKELEEKEKLLKKQEEALELEKSKSFIHRLLGK